MKKRIISLACALLLLLSNVSTAYAGAIVIPATLSAVEVLGSIFISYLAAEGIYSLATGTSLEDYGIRFVDSIEVTDVPEWTKEDQNLLIGERDALKIAEKILADKNGNYDPKKPGDDIEISLWANMAISALVADMIAQYFGGLDSDLDDVNTEFFNLHRNVDTYAILRSSLAACRPGDLERFDEKLSSFTPEEMANWNLLIAPYDSALSDTGREFYFWEPLEDISGTFDTYGISISGFDDHTSDLTYKFMPYSGNQFLQARNVAHNRFTGGFVYYTVPVLSFHTNSVTYFYDRLSVNDVHLYINDGRRVKLVLDDMPFEYDPENQIEIPENKDGTVSYIVPDTKPLLDVATSNEQLPLLDFITELFTGSVTITDPGTDPGTDPDIDPDTDPGTNPGTGIDTSINYQPEDLYIPSRITEKFPFCIPFDIARLVKAFSAAPVTPVFRFPVSFHVPGLQYSEEIIVDMDDFLALVVLLRTVEVIAFLAGLMVVTRTLIRG